ncbi:hypothetical protein L3V82_12450 [Thiotrichales bacterium 19S3-7]|nr:hypothetical protein [Thiotrichales bacterium 19S3-7]MCF6802992.1 hypothetical protein [Thiotrichales bacterium 19S3-11]
MVDILIELPNNEALLYNMRVANMFGLYTKNKINEVEIPSSKGFIAIDLDGTALVQKIDKHPVHGVINSKVDLNKNFFVHDITY